MLSLVTKTAGLSSLFTHSPVLLGSFMASNPNRREPTGSQQSGQAAQAASNGGSSDQQNAGGTRSSSSVESAVRVVPIRTVVAAVPASVGRSTSDSSRSPMGIFYPVLARVQHVSSNNSGASQASDQNNLHGVETRDPFNPDSSGQQQNVGLPGVAGSQLTLQLLLPFDLSIKHLQFMGPEHGARCY